MFMLKHVRVFEKSRTCLKKFMYVFFYKMIGIQLYMFKSYNNSTLQSFVIKDIADIYGIAVVIVTNESKNARCFCWIYLICLNAFPSISVMSLAIMLSSERKAAARSPAVPCKNTPTTAAVSGE